MTTEVYIENFRLDITADLSALLNFALDDIKDFSSRSTAWSKTIVLPGTSNNNQLFGHRFQIGQANEYDGDLPNVGYNFNASKSADCIIFQDNVQAFKGILRLLQINIVKGQIEYEVSVFGKLAGLSVALSGARLEDLDFSEYDHVYNDGNIVASWDNPGGSGVYYPLIDYGTYSTDKHDWDIKTFRPALYVKEYLDKMFAASGFRYEGELFETERFGKLIIPHNAKILTASITKLYDAEITPPQLIGQPGFPGTPFVSAYPNTTGGSLIPFPTLTGVGFIPNIDNTVFTYNGTVTANLTIPFRFEGTYDVIGFPQVEFYVHKNGDGNPIYSTALPFGSPSVSFVINASVTASFAPGDTIEFRILQRPTGGGAINFTLTAGQFSATTASGTGVPVPISVGDSVFANDAIPRNIRQIDFLVALVKMFNLYVYEDRLDTSLIYMKPYINFYQIAHNSSIDWTYKLNRDKAIKMKPMSELTAKIYKFKFKPDSDYYNDLYRKRYSEGYGDRVYDSEFEFTDQVKEFEVAFSATPLVGYGGEEKVYPTIFKRTGPDNAPVEENTDSNIRILQSKKITGVTPWDIMNGPSTVLNTLTRYGYAGHFDDPDVPNEDLNFGATRELFFVLATGNLSNNQFNVFWSGYMSEITNKDSKLLSASFYLTPLDIMKLDFSKLIYVDGGLFRLNAIKDYNMSKPADCTIELLKVNSVNYTEASDPDGPPDGDFLLWSNENIMYFDDAVEGNELLWTGAYQATANWSYSPAIGLGNGLRIFVNAALVIDQTTIGSGTLTLVDNDIVQVTLTRSPMSIDKSLTVSNDIDGVMYSLSSTSNKSYTFTANAGKVYTIEASTTF